MITSSNSMETFGEPSQRLVARATQSVLLSTPHSRRARAASSTVVSPYEVPTCAGVGVGRAQGGGKAKRSLACGRRHAEPTHLKDRVVSEDVRACELAEVLRLRHEDHHGCV